MVKTYVAFDLETTGLNEKSDHIIEIGALKVVDGKVTERFMEFMNPGEPISELITNLTGITDEMVADSREEKAVVRDFLEFCEGHVLLGHNIMFDYRFMKQYAVKNGYSFERSGIDTLKIARQVHKTLESKSLEALCTYYNVINSSAHRAYHDALATAKIYHYMGHYYEEKEPGLFEPQPLLYRPKKEQMITIKQKEFLKRLCGRHKLTLPPDLDTMTRSEASKRIDHILKTYS